MRTPIADSHRALLYVLFGLFEALLVGSVVLLLLTDHRKALAYDDAAGLAFWFAFIGQFSVCFILRKVARRLAVIGWLTLFAGFWSLSLMPIT